MRNRATALRPALVALSVVTLIALGGCTLAPTGDAHFNLGVPGEVKQTVTDVSYYPACGNTPLELDGVTWYPFVPTNLDEFPSPAALGVTGGHGFSRVVPGVPAVAVRAGAVPAVAAPGPGDDVGTVVIYDNRLAHFTSDSGNLSAWLTTKKITYAWVC